MNKVNRYDFCHLGQGEYTVMPEGDGAFVTYTDYHILLAERDTLNQQVVNLAVESATLRSELILSQQKSDIYDMLREDHSLSGSLAEFVDWQARYIAHLESRQ